nr:hypothetical protein [uncultured Clostridium sp.]
MVKKICPVCDLPVNEVNYCPRCRRVVKKPVNWEMNYLLNEKRNQPALPVSQPQAGRPYVNQPAANPSMTGKRPSNILLFALIMVFVIVIMGVAIFSFAVGSIFSENNYETAVGYDDYGYRDLDEAEVIAAEERCSGFDHFEADGRGIADSMVQFLEKGDYGYQISSKETYSDNYEMNEDSGPVTFYETVESVYLEPKTAPEESSGEEEYEYVDINYDTATGELHQYVSYLGDPEASLSYLEQFLMFTEAACGIQTEQSSIPAIMEQAQSRLNQQEGAYILEGIFDINLYIYEDRIQIYVSYNNPEAVKNQET